jgi:hypothetical protein
MRYSCVSVATPAVSGELSPGASTFTQPTVPGTHRPSAGGTTAVGSERPANRSPLGRSRRHAKVTKTRNVSHSVTPIRRRALKKPGVLATPRAACSLYAPDHPSPEGDKIAKSVTFRYLVRPPQEPLVFPISQTESQPSLQVRPVPATRVRGEQAKRPSRNLACAPRRRGRGWNWKLGGGRVN